MRAGALPLLVLVCAAAAPPPQHVLLEVWIDGRDSGHVAAVTQTVHALRMAASDLDALGLTLGLVLPHADGETVDLSSLPNVSTRIDEPGQRLLLTVPVAALPAQRFDLGAPPDAPAPESETGFALHYDLSATTGDVRRAAVTTLGGANLELDMFTPDALFSSTGFVTASAAATSAIRLDSSARFDDPGRLSHVIVGDAITGAPDWARAVRFGGIEVASDFSLRPGFITQPLPSFFGQSAVPATVEVFSGAAKVFEQPLSPGPFALTNLPVVTGGGSATIITSDVLGRQISQSISLYADPGLLAPGLESFALDAGFLRQAYGLRNFDYGAPLVSGDWRGGLTDTLTLAAHGEASRHLLLLGSGGEVGLGVGAISASLAASTGRAGTGWLAALSARALLAPFNLYGAVQAASPEYRDLASLDSTQDSMGIFTVLPPRLRYQLGVTTNLSSMGTPLGTFGLSLIGERAPGTGERQFLSASWSSGLPDGMFLALTGLTDFHSHAASAQVSLSVPLDGGLATVSGQSDRNVGGLASYGRPADPDGGFGYRLQAGWQDGGRFEADAVDIAEHAALEGGVALADGRAGLRAGLSGALLLLRGSLFATHDPGGAVALVQTGDPGIHIYRENRPVAVSDAQGEALLTGLDAWSPNRLGIEVRDYPFDALVEKTDAVVVPRRHGGLVVDFRPVSRHPLLAMIVRGTGVPTPVGARVTLDGEDTPLALGRDGELFVPDLQHGTGASIDLGQRRCRVWLTPGDARQPRTPPLLCLREVADAY